MFIKTSVKGGRRDLIIEPKVEGKIPVSAAMVNRDNQTRRNRLPAR
jgi:hypothetical protein